MENALAISYIMGPVLLVMGISMLLNADHWKKAAEKWGKDPYSLMPWMFLELILSIVVIRMHNTWALNVWLIITLTGWGMFFESLSLFLFPGLAKNMVGYFKNPLWMYIGGVVIVAAGGALTYFAYYA